MKGGRTKENKEWMPQSKLLLAPYYMAQNIRVCKNSYERADFRNDTSYHEVVSDIETFYTDLMTWLREVDEKIRRTDI